MTPDAPGLRARARATVAPAVQRTTTRWETRRLVAGRRHPDVAVFVAPMKHSGGVISLVELAETSHRIGDALGFDAHLARMPRAVVPRTWTPPVGPPVRLPSVDAVLAAHGPKARRVWLHLPEVTFVETLDGLWDPIEALAARGTRVVVNLLNQNIDLVPGPDRLDPVRTRAARVGVELTCTTAHRAYCTPALRETLGFPVHHISTWITPEDYEFARYSATRAHRIVVSPDPSPHRDAVLAAIASVRPAPELRVVHDMTYVDYLTLVRTSRWSMTLGEGLDGYFVEMGLSGGVPFAVYNDRFFTPEYLELPNVFPTWDAFLDEWPEQLAALHADPDRYRAVADATRARLALEYDRRRHVDHLARYYAGRYDHP